jgi:catechol 2,3-dioxygenase-like lactoylglutathione lyase family enzyme
MKQHILVAALMSLAPSLADAQVCTPNPAAPALDHVVLVVSDLDQATSGFHGLGFRLKQGRLHANNLLNRHIKFRDGSSIELMTVAGEPRDEMARAYSRLAVEGDGGVYVALKVSSTSSPLSTADSLELNPQTSSSGPWQFVGFDVGSPAAAVFFSAGGANLQDPDSLVSHTPQVTGLVEAWVEGGPELITLLEKLGASRCRPDRGPDGRLGQRLLLSRGAIVVVPMRAGVRPRVLGAHLASSRVVRTPTTIWPHPTFWLSYISAVP